MTLLLDDFKRFVHDAEARDANGVTDPKSQYARWASANCGGEHGGTVGNPTASSDLGKWYAFRDLILAGQRPSVPVLAPPHGRELIDAGVQYLDATAPVTPPPPPPPTSEATRHFGALRLGDSFPTLQTPSKYGLACGAVGTAAAVKAVDPTHTHRCVYMSCVDVPTWFAGVSYAEVKANGWAVGTETGGYFLDIGNPDAQQAVIREIDAWMRANGLAPGQAGAKTGFYFDDIVTDPRTLMTAPLLIQRRHGDGALAAMTPIERRLAVRQIAQADPDRLEQALAAVAMPTKYPTVKAWHDQALIPWLRTVPPALSALGYYVGGNAIDWFPSGDGATVYPGTDPNTGTMHQAFYREVCPNLDWVMLEDGFYPNNYGIRKEYTSNAQYPAYWGGYRALIPIAEAADCDFYSTVNATDQLALVYTRATYEITASGTREGGVLCAPDASSPNATDPSAAGGNWAKDLGAPLGPTTQAGNVYTRRFANGTVTIDPYAGTASIS